MIMIIGGAYQGKTAYAQEKYKYVSWADGASCTEEELFACQGVLHFQKYIRRILKEGQSTEALFKKLTENNKDIVIVTDEIGYGIVPIDAFERKYREETGRLCTKLAGFSKEVYRVVCGIATRIKG